MVRSPWISRRRAPDPPRQTKAVELGGWKFVLTEPTIGELEDLNTAVNYKEVQTGLMYVKDAYAKFGEAKIGDPEALKGLAWEGSRLARAGVDCYDETNRRLLALVAAVDHDRYRRLPVHVGTALIETIRGWIAAEVMADPASKSWNTLSIAHSSGAQKFIPTTTTRSSRNGSASTKSNMGSTPEPGGGANSESFPARSSRRSA